MESFFDEVKNLPNRLPYLKNIDLIDAAKQRNLSILQNIYNMNSQNINMLDSNHFTPLMVAAFYNQFENIKYLLSCPGIDTNYENKNGDTFMSVLSYSQIDPKDAIRICKKYQILNLGNRCKPLMFSKVIIPPMYIPFQHSNSINKEIFLYDRVEDMKQLTTLQNDYFLLSCQYQAYKCAQYFLSLNFGIDFVSDKGTSGFTYICYFGHKDIALKIVNCLEGNKSLLLLRDRTLLTPLQYIMKKDEMYDVIDRVLNMKNAEDELIHLYPSRLIFYYPKPLSYLTTPLPQLPSSRVTYLNHSSGNYEASQEFKNSTPRNSEISKSLKIYSPYDFECIIYNLSKRGISQTIQSGTYGLIYHAIEKETGFNRTIKKIKYDPSDHQMINETHVREISLLSFVNQIDENVAVKLYGYFFEENTICLVFEYLPYTLFEVYRFYDILQWDANLKKNFIRHLIKNLLENLNIINGIGINHNDIKNNNIMIDMSGKFKIIDFGIAEYFGISPLCDYTHNSLMASFIKPPEGNYSSTEIPGKMIIKRKTLNSDVFSLGSTIMNLIHKTSNIRYISDGYEGFFLDFNDEKNKLYHKLSLNTIKKFDSSLIPFIMKLIDQDAGRRFFAKQALLNHYITGTYKKNEILSKPIITCLPSTSKYERYFEINNELIYMNEIHEASRNIEFGKSIKINDKNNFYQTIEWFMGIFPKYVSFDTFINMIPRISYIFETFRNSQEIIFLACVEFFICSNHFDLFPQKIHHLQKIICASKEDFENEVKKTIIKRSDLFTFVPVITQLEYLTVLLQQHGILEEDIIFINSNLKQMIFEWAVYGNDSCKIWMLIVHCFYFLCNISFDRRNIFRSVFPEIYSDHLDSFLLDKIRENHQIPTKIFIKFT